MLGKFDWTALGVVIQVLAFFALAFTIWKNTQATRLSAHVADAVTAMEVSERLAEAGRRFEAARSIGDKKKMDYEWSYMAATVEVYLAKTDPIRKRIDSDPNLVVVGALRVLLSGPPPPYNSMPAGQLFRKLEFPFAGALAEEKGL